CGTPRGAGGMPSSMKRASDLLSSAISRSPWSTCTSTNGWLSTAVEKVIDLRVGIVVFFGMILVIIPPAVCPPILCRVSTSCGHACLVLLANSHPLDGVYLLVRLLAEELLDHLLHARHAGLPAHQDHLVDLAGLQPGVLERGAAGLERPLHQVLDQRLQLAPG